MVDASDDFLTGLYEQSGLFRKIVDLPACYAVRYGFVLDGETSFSRDFYTGQLDSLEWDLQAATAIKWARLFGGCLVVILVDDGGTLKDKLRMEQIKSVDGLRLYPCFSARPVSGGRSPDLPTAFDVYSGTGCFTVHSSRCLVFKNGALPEKTEIEFWGIPEYCRISEALRNAESAIGKCVELLERGNKEIHKIPGLSSHLETEQGEEMINRRKQAAEMARGMFESIVIDRGEELTRFSADLSGVGDLVDAAYSILAAAAGIPFSILFGYDKRENNMPHRLDPHSSKTRADQKIWYSVVEAFQESMVKPNLTRLLEILYHVGRHVGEPVGDHPPSKIRFLPLQNMTELQQADAELSRAKAQLERARAARRYIEIGAISPQEVRRGRR